MACIIGKIAENINANVCTTNPAGMGYESTGVVLNWDDIDWANVTYSGTNANIVTALPLLSGKVGFTLYQPNPDKPFDGTKITSKASKFAGLKFDKVVQYAILNDSPEAAEEINNGLTGKYVIILTKLEKGLQKTGGAAGNQAYMVIGLEKGLKFTNIELDANSEDTDGGYLVSVTEASAGKVNVFFFDTNYATTAAAVAALLV